MGGKFTKIQKWPYSKTLVIRCNCIDEFISKFSLPFATCSKSNVGDRNVYKIHVTLLNVTSDKTDTIIDYEKHGKDESTGKITISSSKCAVSQTEMKEPVADTNASKSRTCMETFNEEVDKSQQKKKSKEDNTTGDAAKVDGGAVGPVSVEAKKEGDSGKKLQIKFKCTNDFVRAFSSLKKKNMAFSKPRILTGIRKNYLVIDVTLLNVTSNKSIIIDYKKNDQGGSTGKITISSGMSVASNTYATEMNRPVTNTNSKINRNDMETSDEKVAEAEKKDISLDVSYSTSPKQGRLAGSGTGTKYAGTRKSGARYVKNVSVKGHAKRVQILDTIQTKASKRFATALKNTLRHFDCIILKNTDELNDKGPLIVICVRYTRLISDVDLALENVKYTSQYVVVIVHIGRVSNRPIPKSSEKLATYKKRIIFIDMVFDVDGEDIYKCQHNEEQIQDLNDHLYDLLWRRASVYALPTLV